MKDTIASIQRDEAHSPFMLERLYNQVCSKCVHYVRDLSYRGALSTTSVGSALDAAYAALATALALLTTAFALRTADLAELHGVLVEPQPSPTCAFAVRTAPSPTSAAFADPPSLPTRRPCLRLATALPSPTLRRRTSQCAESRASHRVGPPPNMYCIRPCTGEDAEAGGQAACSDTSARTR